jgi:hypothetical protein
MSSKKRKSAEEGGEDREKNKKKSASDASNGDRGDGESKHKHKKEKKRATDEKKPEIKDEKKKKKKSRKFSSSEEKASSKKKGKKKRSSTGSKSRQPPGFAIVTAENSSGGSGRCKVVVKMSESSESNDGISEAWLSGSSSFQILNDKGARGSSVMIGPDAIDLMDSAATTVLDTVILHALMFHHMVDQKGLATNSANGVILHPEEQAAKGKKLSEKGKYVLKPYSLAMAVQMNENLRKLFGDVKLPDDSRPPTVVDVYAGSSSQSRGKKSPGSGKKDSSDPNATLAMILEDHGIKI